MRENVKLRRVVWVVALCLLPWTAGLSAKEDCSAQADAVLTKTIEKENSTVLEFEIGVVSGHKCANVDYHLILEVQSPNGKTDKVVIAREVRLQKGSHQDQIKHKMDKGHTMLGHETEIKRCHVCEG